jgi:hypothetical protein
MDEDNQGGGATNLGATPVAWWRSHQDVRDGDRMRARPYHITLSLHMMLIFLWILFSLDLIARQHYKMILSHNIKIIICSSIVCTIEKVHHFETPRDDWVWQTQRSHTTGESQFLHMWILWFYLASLACTYMASEHEPKGKARVIWMIWWPCRCSPLQLHRLTWWSVSM